MNRHAQCGFTIMELLIASTLASILMVGILFATTQQARQVQRLQKRVSPTELDAIVQLFQRDLMLATACRIKDEQIQLQGYFKLDKKNFKQTQQPAEVIYRLAEIADETWLIRHQRDPKSLTLEDSSANLLCKGITSMQLLLVESATDELQRDKTLTENADGVEDINLQTEVDTDTTSEPALLPDSQSTDAIQEVPGAFTDQWTALPPVLQWVVTRSAQREPTQESDQDTDENTLTFSLVLR